MVGSWRHRTQRSTLYSCGPCVKTKRTCKHGRKNWDRLCLSLNWTTVSMWLPAGVHANPEEAATALLLGAAQLELRSSWRSEPPSSPFYQDPTSIFYFFFQDPAGSLHYRTSLKDYARLSFRRDTEELRHRAPNFQLVLILMCPNLIWTIKPPIKVNYGCFCLVFFSFFCLMLWWRD